MKIYDEIDLANFEFWGDAVDTARKLTLSQFNAVDACLSVMYPNGISPRYLNDLFCDSNYIYGIAGVYPKYFRITSDCGTEKYIKCADEDEEDELESSGIESEEVDENETKYENVEDMSSFDIASFKDTHVFKITSLVRYSHLLITCEDNAVDDLKEAFAPCQITEVNDYKDVDSASDWQDYYGDHEMIEEFVYDEDEHMDEYQIPTYAIYRICELLNDPNDELDYYEVPDTFALNECNRYLELTDEDEENIEKFVKQVRERFSDNFLINWDEESCGSPYFSVKPEFGLACDCVTLRVYEDEKDKD